MTDNRISALAPVLNEAPILEQFLTRLRLAGADEIVVADGGSEDDSVAIARALADKVVIGPRGRGRQIAMAAKEASAEIFWIVHCDCTPPKNAKSEIIGTLARKNVRMGAFPIAFDADHPLLQCYSFLSRFDSPLSTFGDQGFFMHAADYRRAGGAPETALFEDVELRKRFRRLGEIGKTRSPMKTSARRFLANGIVRQQATNALLLVRYFAGAHPDDLASAYRGSASA